MKAEFKPVPVEDPAGLDKLLLAAGKGCARYLEGLMQSKLGRSVNVWDGPDGLGAILEENLKAAGVPNKRLLDMLTPRAVLEAGGGFKVVPKRPYYPNGVKRKTRPRRRLQR